MDYDYLIGLPEPVLFPITDLERWLELHPKLEVKTMSCPDCLEIVQTCIPFASKSYRGLCTARCECEHDEVGYTYYKIKLP